MFLAAGCVHQDAHSAESQGDHPLFEEFTCSQRPLRSFQLEPSMGGRGGGGVDSLLDLDPTRPARNIERRPRSPILRQLPGANALGRQRALSANGGPPQRPRGTSPRCASHLGERGPEIAASRRWLTRRSAQPPSRKALASRSTTRQSSPLKPAGLPSLVCGSAGCQDLASFCRLASKMRILLLLDYTEEECRRRILLLDYS